MNLLHTLIDISLHLDKHLNDLAGRMGASLYLILMAIIFAETGLVVTPFLPGDSLLFAVGALAANPQSPINLVLVCVLLCLSANCGDVTNYTIGRTLGPKLFRRSAEEETASAGEGGVGCAAPPKTLLDRVLNRKHLEQAQHFYNKHGRKTIILARFVPIIRTFAPFVAGVGKMEFSRFIGFSIGGGILWVVLLTLAGYFFGRIPVVQHNFELVVLAIVGVSVIPVAAHAIKRKFVEKK